MAIVVPEQSPCGIASVKVTDVPRASISHPTEATDRTIFLGFRP